MFARSNNELRYNSDCEVGGPAAALQPALQPAPH